TIAAGGGPGCPTRRISLKWTRGALPMAGSTAGRGAERRQILSRSPPSRPRTRSSAPIPSATPRRAPVTPCCVLFQTRPSSSIGFGEPIVDGEQAAVEYWAVLRPSSGEQTLAGISRDPFRARRAGRRAAGLVIDGARPHAAALLARETTRAK